MSKSITKNGEIITVENCEKAIDDVVRSLNEINVALKNRNLPKEKKEELQSAMKAGVENLVDLTAASLVGGFITVDKYKILRAEVSPKSFKGFSGHVNGMIKTYMEVQTKAPIHTNSHLSLVELAKLVETPYRTTVEEAKEVLAEATVKEDAPTGLLANTLAPATPTDIVTGRPIITNEDGLTTPAAPVEAEDVVEDDLLDVGSVDISIPGLNPKPVEVLTPIEVKEDASTPESLKAEGYDDNQMKIVDAAPEVDGETVVEVVSPTGDKAIIDKEEGAIYLDGTWKGKAVVWKKKLIGTTYTWYETVKNLLSATFILVWDLVLSVANNIIATVGNIGLCGVNLVTYTAKSFMGAGSKFYKNIKSAYARGNDKARERGLIYGEIKNPN